MRAPKRKSQIQLYYYLKIITLTAICSGVTLTFATILPAVEHNILTHTTLKCQILQLRLLTITKPMKQYSALSFFSTFLFGAMVLILAML